MGELLHLLQQRGYAAAQSPSRCIKWTTHETKTNIPTSYYLLYGKNGQDNWTAICQWNTDKILFPV